MAKVVYIEFISFDLPPVTRHVSTMSSPSSIGPNIVPFCWWPQRFNTNGYSGGTTEYKYRRIRHRSTQRQPHVYNERNSTEYGGEMFPERSETGKNDVESKGENKTIQFLFSKFGMKSTTMLHIDIILSRCKSYMYKSKQHFVVSHIEWNFWLRFVEYVWNILRFWGRFRHKTDET